MPQAPISRSSTSGRAANCCLERAQVGDLAGAGDRDEAAGLAVAAQVVGENGVAERREEALRELVRVRAVAAEAVDQDHAGPAGGRRLAARDVEGRSDRVAVVHHRDAVAAS